MPGKAHPARVGRQDDTAGDVVLHPGGECFKLGLIGFRNGFSYEFPFVSNTLHPIKRGRAVGSKMPRALLHRHVAGMRRGGGGQFLVEYEWPDARSVAQGIDSVE